MSTELAQRENGTQLQHTPAVPANASQATAAAQELEIFRSFVRSALTKSLDFDRIPGTSKDTLLKPGAEKIFAYYNVFPRHTIDRRDLGDGHLEVTVQTQLISRATGNQLGEGWGSCTSMENKYRFRAGAMTCPECGAETVRKGKKEYGGGFFCDRRAGGCGTNFDAQDPDLKDQDGKVENKNPWEVRNTVLKMALKRSDVCAALTLGCASELFTQDLEDFRPATAEARGGKRDDQVDQPTTRQRQTRRTPPRPEDHPDYDGEPPPRREPARQGRPPATGKALFAWIKEQEQARPDLGLLKKLNQWGKQQDLPSRMIDWSPEDVSRAFIAAQAAIAETEPVEQQARRGRAEQKRAEHHATQGLQPLVANIVNARNAAWRQRAREMGIPLNQAGTPVTANAILRELYELARDENWLPANHQRPRDDRLIATLEPIFRDFGDTVSRHLWEIADGLVDDHAATFTDDDLDTAAAAAPATREPGEEG